MSYKTWVDKYFYGEAISVDGDLESAYNAAIEEAAKVVEETCNLVGDDHGEYLAKQVRNLKESDNE